MRCAILLLLVPLAAQAQFLPPTGGGSSSSGDGGTALDPNRNDVASSYRANGSGGILLTPQVTAGTCATAADTGRVSWLSPSGLSVCDGVAWRRVWQANDGVTVSPDRDILPHGVVTQALDGEYAFRSNNKAIWDIGPGTADFFSSNGTGILFGGSLVMGTGQSLSVNILTSPTAKQQIAGLTSWWQLLSQGTVPACTSSDRGGLSTLTSDGRPYWCDGTASAAIGRSLFGSATIDPALLTPGSCSTLTGTVTGALTTDGVVINPSIDLLDGLVMTSARVSATNTVSVKLCNFLTVANVDQPSTTFTFTVLR